MILELNQSFNDCFVEQKLDLKSTSYREVYRGRMPDGKLVFLTVYDVRKMPACMDSKDIKEFALYPQLVDSIFPAYISQGRCAYQGDEIAWMMTQYVECVSLRSLELNGGIRMADPAGFILELTMGVREIERKTNGGGHYDLNYDTVLAAECGREGDRVKYTPILIDLSHASSVCSGNPPFEVKNMNTLFRAKETFLGRFNTSSDIYSLGVLLAYCVAGKMPYPVNEKSDTFENIRAISESQPDVPVTEEFKAVMRKAVSVSVSGRYNNLNAFIRALSPFSPAWKDGNPALEDDPLDDEEFVTYRNQVNRPHGGAQPLEETNVFSPASPQVLRVTMEVKKGNGFKAVAGMAELKRKLRRDFIDLIAHRDLAATYDILPPNLLLYGPPGTGKTYISMRLAEECEMECSVVNPSDLGSIYVHGSQSMIKELFYKAEMRAKKNGKGVLIIFDEFDAFCPQRTPEDRNNQAGEVAEFLVQLNNCYERNIFVIGTTNCLDRVDKAVIRKGRIDEVIFIGMPDHQCRRDLFQLELTKRPHEENIDLEELAVMTDGYTSGDIAYLVKETARNTFEAALKQKDLDPIKISQSMLESVIHSSSPSVSRAEVRKYEKMRDAFIREKKKDGQRVGFVV